MKHALVPGCYLVDSLPSVTISEKSAIVENSFTTVCNRDRRLARRVSSSTMTMTLSKNLSIAGRSFAISSSAHRRPGQADPFKWVRDEIRKGRPVLASFPKEVWQDLPPGFIAAHPWSG